jgi:MFS family permease
LFGFLDRFDDHTTFITLSFVVRIVEALGDAAFITASFAIIAAEFPDSVATTFASLETFFGLGLIVGPTLGGALYQRGGFTLPFAVMGGLLLVVAILTFLLMPASKPQEEEQAGGKRAPAGVLQILKVPGVALAATSIVTGSITIGFLNSTLEPHIRQFALTPVLTGLVFIINGGLYAVTAPAWGWLCDRALQPIYAGLIGAVTIFVGFLLIGPVPFIPVETVLWLTCVGLLIHGIGLGATLVAAFVMALRESINHGFADNIQTYGLTSALWTSSFALGAFVGPSIGGILLDEVGFQWASVFVLGVQAVLTILILSYIAKTRQGSASFSKRNLSEHAPLLGSVSEDPCTSKTAMSRQGGSNNGAGYGATAGSLA